jgi:GNAT superfamily N-acetyltransferase
MRGNVHSVILHLLISNNTFQEWESQRMGASDIVIRAMQDSDADAMHIIHERAVRQSCAPLLSPQVVAAWLRGRSPEGYLRARNEGGENFLIAENRGLRAGFASWRGSWLEALFVDPDHQSTGVGKALLIACEEAAEAQNIFLSDLNATLNARSFYETAGFRVMEEGYEEKFGERIPHLAMMRLARPERS